MARPKSDEVDDESRQEYQQGYSSNKNIKILEYPPPVDIAEEENHESDENTQYIGNKHIVLSMCLLFWIVIIWIPPYG